MVSSIISCIKNGLNETSFIELATKIVLSGSVVMATRLCSVAMREKNSDVIEVRLGEQKDELQVLMNQQVLSFSEQIWIDLKGKTSLFILSKTVYQKHKI